MSSPVASPKRPLAVEPSKRPFPTGGITMIQESGLTTPNCVGASSGGPGVIMPPQEELIPPELDEAAVVEEGKTL